MPWTDAFTGAASKKAANATIGGLKTAQNDAVDAIDAAVAGARNDLLLGGKNAINAGYGTGLSALKEFYPQAQGYAGQATAAYQPMVNAGLGGLNAYADAAGAAGPEGNARAVTNFQAGPGYEFTRDQGLDAVTRMANARGMLQSGNTSADLMKYGTGLANQTWGDYMSRLQPLMQMYGTGVAGQAAGLTNQASLANDQGTARANLATNRGTSLAGLYGQAANASMTGGMNQAGILGNLGSRMAQAQGQGIMGAANAQANTINQGLGLVGQLGSLPTAGGGSLATDFYKRFALGAVPAQYG